MSAKVKIYVKVQLNSLRKGSFVRCGSRGKMEESLKLTE
jgi:hypothetical protein